MTDPEIIRALYSLQLTGGAETPQNATIRRVPEGAHFVNENNKNKVDLHRFVVDGLSCFAGYSSMTNTLYVANLPGERESKNFMQVFVYDDGREIEQRVSYREWSIPPLAHFVECDADGKNPIEYVVMHVETEKDKKYIFVSESSASR